MKKAILTLALASFGAVAFAQEAAPSAVPANQPAYVISAKFAYESKYISGGQKHSNSNFQTDIALEYLLPTQGLDSLSLYGKFFYMSPISKQYNEAKLTGGLRGDFAQEYFFDLGYRFSGYPNSNGHRAESAWEMNRPELNRSNETYIGIGRDVRFLDDAEWSEVRLSAYGYYNWNIEQYTIEVAAEKTFKHVFVDELDIYSKLAYGYACANNWGGDQHAWTQDLDSYDYGYFTAQVDAIYKLNETTSLSVGARYAYNNGDDGIKSPNNDCSDFWVGASISFSY